MSPSTTIFDHVLLLGRIGVDGLPCGVRGRRLVLPNADWLLLELLDTFILLLSPVDDVGGVRVVVVCFPLCNFLLLVPTGEVNWLFAILDDVAATVAWSCVSKMRSGLCLEEDSYVQVGKYNFTRE